MDPGLQLEVGAQRAPRLLANDDWVKSLDSEGIVVSRWHGTARGVQWSLGKVATLTSLTCVCASGCWSHVTLIAYDIAVCWSHVTLLITCDIAHTCLLCLLITLHAHMLAHWVAAANISSHFYAQMLLLHLSLFFAHMLLLLLHLSSVPQKAAMQYHNMLKTLQKKGKKWGKDIFHVFLLRGRRPYWRSSPQAHHLAQQHLTWRTCVYKYKPGFNCKYRYIANTNSGTNTNTTIEPSPYNTRPLSLTWCRQRQIQIRI